MNEIKIPHKSNYSKKITHILHRKSFWALQMFAFKSFSTKKWNFPLEKNHLNRFKRSNGKFTNFLFNFADNSELNFLPFDRNFILFQFQYKYLPVFWSFWLESIFSLRFPCVKLVKNINRNFPSNENLKKKSKNERKFHT